MIVVLFTLRVASRLVLWAWNVCDLIIAIKSIVGLPTELKLAGYPVSGFENPGE